MTYREDIDRVHREHANSKSPISFRNIFLVCLVFILGGWYIAEDKRSGFEKQIEKAKQDSVKHQTAKTHGPFL